MKKDSLLLLLIIAVVAVPMLVLPLIHKNESVKVERDTILTTETMFIERNFHDTVPVYLHKTVTKKDTIYKVDADTALPVVMELAQKAYGNTIVQDSDTITYNAYITGRSLEDEDYPTLDSINFNIRASRTYVVPTITETITRRQRPSGWAITPNVGVGVGLVNRKVDVYAGVGIGYSFPLKRKYK